MEIRKQPLGLYKANCYILVHDDGTSIIIDPGFHRNRIIELVGDTKPLAIVLTHGHCDHICALDEVAKFYGIPTYLHDGDHELLQLIRRRPSAYKKKMYTQCESLGEGQLQIGQFFFDIIPTPGHSAGSVCIRWRNDLFTGDTVFTGHIGNSDNFNGNEEDLRKSISKILTLPNEIHIHPGHKDDTTIGLERYFLSNVFSS